MKFILVYGICLILLFTSSYGTRHNKKLKLVKKQPEGPRLGPFRDLNAKQEQKFLNFRKYAKLAMNLNKIERLDKKKWTLVKSIETFSEPDIKIYGFLNTQRSIAVIGFAEFAKASFNKYFTRTRFFKSAPTFCSACMIQTELDNQYKAFVGKADELLKDLLEKMNKEKKVRIIGHGFGGAQANLFAVHAKANTMIKDFKLYTFGAARVGDEKYAEYASSILGDENEIRVVYKNDPVAIVPTRNKGFKHSGTLFSINFLPRFVNGGTADAQGNSQARTIYLKNHWLYDDIWKYEDSPENTKKIDYAKIRMPTDVERKLLSDSLKKDG